MQHVKMLERELLAVGIRPEISRTGSGHIRLSWNANGRRQQTIVSQTPTDHRGVLNARAIIRKHLREAGVTGEIAQPKKLQEAMTIASAPADLMLAERVTQLEADMGALLDLYAEMRADAYHHTTPAPDANDGKQPKDAQRAKEREQPNLGQRKKPWPLRYMRYDQWLTLSDIYADCPPSRSKGALSVMLTRLKREGLVENGKEGWRKKPAADRL